MFFILGLVLVFIIIYIRKKYFLYALLNKGEVFYLDSAGSELFVNKSYGVTAKPDRISVYKGKKYVIEFKSRKKGVYDKDMVQALVGALASYDYGLKPDFALVYNSSHEYKLVRFKNEKALYKKIKKLIDRTKTIKSTKSISFFFKKGKCAACVYSKSCSKAG
ncbi:Dna2/Cas4 domain-containing protein [Pseudoalteromonas marina]|uniref:Dna2/Cas4 domain-containing protein n=1 Tax=Pseudoalteromonas marina TaxID=267375 RepID=A0ABT9FC98_9GAMM|nr:Dna2/Cas4 domain-containing protein [Pseudoalteromonas marina]MDP2564390.1 Dna2/Cas4 domain-containing protein [Pseudoalteromonas marina]